MNANLIFLNEQDLDKPIYRIFNFTRLKEMLELQKLTLVKPKLWDDPFENFILSSTGVLPDGREFHNEFRNSFYGQCWSLTKESDAMWRIYSPEKDGVKIKTTIRKLFDPLFQIGGMYKLHGDIYNLKSFVGKVQYQSTHKLLSMLTDSERMSNKIFDQTGWGQASTFYFKRWAFRHENEVRLMFNKHEDCQEKIYRFEITPNELIDEIVFDPRMNTLEYCKKRDEVVSLGYSKSIKQSELYQIKEFRMQMREL